MPFAGKRVAKCMSKKTEEKERHELGGEEENSKIEPTTLPRTILYVLVSTP